MDDYLNTESYGVVTEEHCFYSVNNSTQYNSVVNGLEILRKPEKSNQDQ
jgi:hypothetical protein